MATASPWGRLQPTPNGTTKLRFDFDAFRFVKTKKYDDNLTQLVYPGPCDCQSLNKIFMRTSSERIAVLAAQEYCPRCTKPYFLSIIMYRISGDKPIRLSKGYEAKNFVCARHRGWSLGFSSKYCRCWNADTRGEDCECGYYINSVDNSPAPILFTDVLESDFLHIRDITLDTDWKRQNFSVTAAAGRGPYGMNFSIQNVLSNPILDLNNWTGPGLHGNTAGVQLLVDPGVPSNGYVQSAQVNSAREDMLWGSYRAAMQLSSEPGTCAAFFWYFNDTQEIDMEFLSSQFIPENNTFPVNLVLQSQAAANAGFNAVGTGNYVVANLPFNPTNGFHEYRMDFVPGSVVFYADGIILAKMNTSAVPDMPGHMILTQWSNGNPLWSFGPPAKEAVATVSYVKAYFNSSEAARQSALASRCKDPSGDGATCVIPDQIGPPDPAKDQQANSSKPSTYFFSDDHNKTIGQTIYHKSGVTALHRRVSWSSLVMTLLPFTVFNFIL